MRRGQQSFSFHRLFEHDAVRHRQHGDERLHGRGTRDAYPERMVYVSSTDLPLIWLTRPLLARCSDRRDAQGRRQRAGPIQYGRIAYVLRPLVLDGRLLTRASSRIGIRYSCRSRRVAHPPRRGPVLFRARRFILAHKLRSAFREEGPGERTAPRDHPNAARLADPGRAATHAH